MGRQSDKKSEQPLRTEQSSHGYYFKAAVGGAIVWVVLGTLFGDFLVDQMMKNIWGSSSGSEFPAMVAFFVLVMPVGVLTPEVVDEPNWLVLTVVYALNGLLWGMALTFVYSLVRRFKRSRGTKS